MKKHYFIILFLTFVFFSAQHGFAQNKGSDFSKNQSIVGLTIYPNPVSSGKENIYITSKHNLNKKVEFYNVLGKQIFSIDLVGNELNISNLNRGVYILKITEGTVSETRKLIIK